MCNVPNKLLLEEWKQNVALYIDQDKRGMERIKVFLTVHAGLLIFQGILWNAPLNRWSVYAGCLLSLVGVFFTIITQLMSRRAHAYILLRKLQGMIIENAMKNLVASKETWKTSNGIITTFTREHVLFRRKKDQEKDPEHLRNDWNSLIEETKAMGGYASNPVILNGLWSFSIGHLRWLTLVYCTLYVFWPILGIFIAFGYYLYC